jgi:hypothetical protein
VDFLSTNSAVDLLLQKSYHKVMETSGFQSQQQNSMPPTPKKEEREPIAVFKSVVGINILVLVVYQSILIFLVTFLMITAKQHNSYYQPYPIVSFASFIFIAHAVILILKALADLASGKTTQSAFSFLAAFLIFLVGILSLAYLPHFILNFLFR